MHTESRRFPPALGGCFLVPLFVPFQALRGHPAFCSPWVPGSHVQVFAWGHPAPSSRSVCSPSLPRPLSPQCTVPKTSRSEGGVSIGPGAACAPGREGI